MLFAGVAEAGVQARWAFTFALPGGGLGYNYHLELVSGTLQPGATYSQHLTLYDVAGLVPGSVSTLPDWTVTVQSTGVDADDVPLSGKQDSPKHFNITWTWNGTTPVAAPFDFGFISYDVTAGTTAGLRLFVGQSTGELGSLRTLIGRTRGPQP